VKQDDRVVVELWRQLQQCQVTRLCNLPSVCPCCVVTFGCGSVVPVLLACRGKAQCRRFIVRIACASIADSAVCHCSLIVLTGNSHTETEHNSDPGRCPCGQRRRHRGQRQGNRYCAGSVCDCVRACVRVERMMVYLSWVCGEVARWRWCCLAVD
jgi:hypothetical protein